MKTITKHKISQHIELPIIVELPKGATFLTAQTQNAERRAKPQPPTIQK